MTTAAEKVVVPEKTEGSDKPAAQPDKRRALGRGLDSLLPSGPRVVATTASAAASAPAPSPGGVIGDLHAQAIRPQPVDRNEVVDLRLESIEHNPYQTRSKIAEAELGELAASIHEHGLIQPITVRPGTNGKFVLITGERRLRASAIAGRNKIPAIIRHVSVKQAAEMTIVENLQRQDLNCVDQALAFARLGQEFNMTQEQIAQSTGSTRSTVSNYTRLLKLPAEVQILLMEGQLDFSHARILLTLIHPEQVVTIARQAAEKHLSVEQLETLVAHANQPSEPTDKAPGQERWVDPNVRAAQDALVQALGLKVKIRDRKGKGKIVIEYASLEDFDRVVDMLKGSRQ